MAAGSDFGILLAPGGVDGRAEPSRAELNRAKPGYDPRDRDRYKNDLGRTLTIKPPPLSPKRTQSEPIGPKRPQRPLEQTPNLVFVSSVMEATVVFVVLHNGGRFPICFPP